MKRVKTVSVLIVSILVMCLMSGCGGSKKVSPEQMAKLYGTWAKTEEDMTTTYTLNADGTFSETVDTTGDFAISMSSTGTYTYDGETLELLLEEYDVPYSYVVSFDGADMIWEKNGNTMRYVKKN